MLVEAIFSTRLSDPHFNENLADSPILKFLDIFMLLSDVIYERILHDHKRLSFYIFAFRDITILFAITRKKKNWPVIQSFFASMWRIFIIRMQRTRTWTRDKDGYLFSSHRLSEWATKSVESCWSFYRPAAFAFFHSSLYVTYLKLHFWFVKWPKSDIGCIFWRNSPIWVKEPNVVWKFQTEIRVWWKFQVSLKRKHFDILEKSEEETDEKYFLGCFIKQAP